MRKSITIQVTTVAGAEVLADALHGVADLPRVINTIHHEQGTDLRLRAYKNQERVIDAASDCNDYDHNPVLCDIPLETGDTFQVGFQSDGATGAAHYITIDFTEG